ncbi:glycosyltransferase family 2 protein [Rhizobium leguminosarum]|uniref:glycosyltransferase family 2 protein n=1 Tax=Rhizobium leguminosarum TaxID=384 RepID=UPI001C98CB5F|nr:glycosyltransferase family 2 protein [Rhizobium leguminosarum]MBY5790006.1 glycosyltransferase [Rhizobium leguminosarum]
MISRFSSLGLGIALRRLLGVRLGRFHQYGPRQLSVAAIKHVGDDDRLPMISLVTPSFNQAHFVEKTLESVLGQNYPKLQYIVQDGLSSDGTQEILGRYTTRNIDIRIEADDGQTDALNKGFAHTDGEIMGYLNSDDLLLPGTLRLVGRYFRDNPSVDVIYGNRLIVDEVGREVGRWVLPEHNSEILTFIDYVPQETMFWRRRIWERAGGRFDTDFHFAMDWELLLRFIHAGAVFRHLPGLFGAFRVHRNQKSQADFLVRGAGEMNGLRLRYGSKNMNFVRRVVLHWAYLSQHRLADAAFEASLRQNG